MTFGKEQQLTAQALRLGVTLFCVALMGSGHSAAGHNRQLMWAT